jgi:hypothetical protein
MLNCIVIFVVFGSDNMQFSTWIEVNQHYLALIRTISSVVATVVASFVGLTIVGWI